MEIRKATMEDFDSILELKLKLKELAIKVYSENTAALKLFHSIGFTDFSVKIFKEL